MIAEIFATGDELLSGAIVDSNSAWIAGSLTEAGIAVSQKSCVGDNLEKLIAVLEEIGSRADVAIVTGGLGPTEDDLTAQAAAGACGVELEFSDEADRSIKMFFQSRNRPEQLADRKQAMLPKGARCLPNPVGTAPGFAVKIDRCMVFCVPGVPSEMKHMVRNHVLPEIIRLAEQEQTVFLIRKLSVFGLPESVAGKHLEGFSSVFRNVKLGFRAHFPMIQIRLYATGKTETTVRQELEDAAAWVADRIGPWIFSHAGHTMEEEVGRLLIQSRATLGIAESCTGGLIAHLMTNVPGSSAYFLFSGVTYSNQAKIKILNVSQKTLDEYGAVSEQVVQEMARGVRAASGATYGLATSGIAGPDGGTTEKPVGTVCIGIATPQTVVTRRLQLSFGSREKNKIIFAMAAMELLRKEISTAL